MMTWAGRSGGYSRVMTPSPVPDPRLAEEERAEILGLLEQSRRGFVQAIEGLTDAQWTWKPFGGGWSVGEVAEHVVLAEFMVFNVVRRTMRALSDPDWSRKTGSKTATLRRLLLERGGKANAPDSLVPREHLNVAEAKARFDRGRERIVAFVTEGGGPLKEQVLTHPMAAFGDLNAHQWLLYLPLHTMRHVQQIAEIKSSAGFPA
jgi:uncharacterized damage-inducible protein DinB